MVQVQPKIFEKSGKNVRDIHFIGKNVKHFHESKN